jgi:hypothetical protein
VKLLAFSIYDVKVEAFMAPFYARSFGEAERFFGDMQSDKSGPVGRHPQDYNLFHVGTFDETTGKLGGLEEFVKVVVESGPPRLEVSDGR